MPLDISQNHPTLLLKDKIQEISHNFLGSLGLSYFQYLRCYADGSVGLLTNETGLLEYFKNIDHSPVIFSSFQEQHKEAHSYWFLWDEELPSEPVRLAREKFNIRHGLTQVRRTQDYYDMIAVALPEEHANPATFYLNKMKAIEYFINEFDRVNKDLIGVMEKNPLALPKPYQDVNCEKICLSAGRVNVLGSQGWTYITAQELACLRLLVMKNTHKEIALAMGISARSVETYILRVKERTGYSTQSELNQMMIRCP